MGKSNYTTAQTNSQSALSISQEKWEEMYNKELEVTYSSIRKHFNSIYSEPLSTSFAEKDINYLKRAVSIIKKIKASEDTKRFLLGAITLLSPYIEYEKEKKKREHFEWCPIDYAPEDFESIDLDNPETFEGFGDVEGIIEALDDEIGTILTDLWEMLGNNNGGFYNDDIQEFLDAYENYIDVSVQIGLRERLPEYLEQERARIEEELKKQDLEGRY